MDLEGRTITPWHALFWEESKKESRDHTFFLLAYINLTENSMSVAGTIADPHTNETCLKVKDKGMMLKTNLIGLANTLPGKSLSELISLPKTQQQIINDTLAECVIESAVCEKDGIFVTISGPELFYSKASGGSYERA